MSNNAAQDDIYVYRHTKVSSLLALESEWVELLYSCQHFSHQLCATSRSLTQVIASTLGRNRRFWKTNPWKEVPIQESLCPASTIVLNYSLWCWDLKLNLAYPEHKDCDPVQQLNVVSSCVMDQELTEWPHTNLNYPVDVTNWGSWAVIILFLKFFLESSRISC